MTTQPASRSPPRGPGSASGKSLQQTATTKTRRWDGDPEAAPRTPSAGWLSRDRGPMASNPRAGVGGVTLNLCPLLRILEEGARGRLSWASRNFYRPQRTDSYPSPGSPHPPLGTRGPAGGLGLALTSAPSPKTLLGPQTTHHTPSRPAPSTCPPRRWAAGPRRGCRFAPGPRPDPQVTHARAPGSGPGRRRGQGARPAAVLGPAPGSGRSPGPRPALTRSPGPWT